MNFLLCYLIQHNAFDPYLTPFADPVCIFFFSLRVIPFLSRKRLREDRRKKKGPGRLRESIFFKNLNFKLFRKNPRPKQKTKPLTASWKC